MMKVTQICNINSEDLKTNQWRMDLLEHLCTGKNFIEEDRYSNVVGMLFAKKNQQARIYESFETMQLTVMMTYPLWHSLEPKHIWNVSWSI